MSDTLVGPIVAQLILVAQQIEGIGRCYPLVPDAAPEDNSVMFAVKSIPITSGTNGRLDMVFEFDILHCFRRGRLQETLARCYAAMPDWATVLGSYRNVRLNNTVKLLDLTEIDIKEVTHGGQKMLAVVSHVRVLHEFAIPI